MNKPLYVVLVLGAFGWWHPVWGYEILTHEKMSHETTMGSMLGKPDGKVLADLGLKFSITDDRQQFPNSSGEQRNIRDLIGDGAKFEDNDSRPLNHFYDPYYNRPLTVFGMERGKRSPDWALEDVTEVSGQESSYRNARQYLYDALAAKTTTERDRSFGLLFQSLGQAIHHLQDMAQPQHVRNDTHCDQWYCRIIGLYHPSGYEKYTDLRDVRDNLLFSGYAAVAFTKPRDFWTTADQKGLAQFTNRNFVSAGTNYQLLNGQPAPNATYPQPVPMPGQSIHIRDLLAEEGSTTDLDGYIDFIANTVTDPIGGDKPNPRSASTSIFDQDLKTYNTTITYDTDPFDPNFNIEVTVDRIPTLNRFNFKAAHEFLIPRAVAYGAGLIDYFFRGRLEGEDIEFSDTGIRLKVKNAIDAQKTPAWNEEVLYANTASGAGTLIVSYDYKDPTGATHYGASLPVNMIAGDSIGPGQVSKNVYSFALSIPQGATEVKYRLVFRGRLGQEESAIAVGMIEPLSGFLVTPNYLPADGIAGRRLLSNVGGNWTLNDKSGLVAGNVDWKGWYVNGRATRVLSWVIPGRRYLPFDSGSFDRSIFQNGEIWAVAPYPVLGAALMREGAGSEWIVAICQLGSDDIVLRKPNQKDLSNAFFDPNLSPDGWEVINRFPAENGRLVADRPWLFNGSGTEAQTMRRNNATNKNSVTRLKITITGSTAQLTDLGNLEGIAYTETTDVTSTGSPLLVGCIPGQTGTEERTITRRVTHTGEYIVAVDYKDAAESLVKVRGTGEEVSSENVSTPWSMPFCSPSTVIVRGDSQHNFSATSSIATLLEFEGLRLVLSGHYGSVQGDFVTPWGGDYRLSGSSASNTSSEIFTLVDMDIRHGLYKGLKLVGEGRRTVSVDKEQICINPTKSENVIKDIVFYGSALIADTATYPPFLGGCRIRRPHLDNEPIQPYLRNWGSDPPRPPVLPTYFDKGSFAVDTTGNLFVSGTTVSSSKAFRYFSGGDLGVIAPPLPANGIFHPIGLVR